MVFAPRADGGAIGCHGNPHLLSRFAGCLATSVRLEPPPSSHGVASSHPARHPLYAVSNNAVCSPYAKTTLIYFYVRPWLGVDPNRLASNKYRYLTLRCCGNTYKCAAAAAYLDPSCSMRSQVVNLSRSPSPSAAEEAEEEESSRSGPRQQQQLTKQKSDERLRQIQGEVENRRSEFARLLEEHAQVVARLKAIESSAAASPV
ncbi:hypothetical protein B566_EDAN012279 [Ephemera danica]|nr:hypothetical protein B566_EDAN012279 [Ephemera danica]